MNSKGKGLARMLKIKAAVLCATAALVVGHGLSRALAAGGVQRKGGRGRTSAETLAQGRTVYAANCARCHGGDGVGRTTLGEMVEAPDLTDARWQGRRGDARMISSVTRGRGQMPAFGKKLSKDEIAAAVAYVRTLKK